MSSRYNAADIEVLSGLDPVKRRPGMYTDTTRPNHLAQEVIDNAVDEALAGHARSIEVTLYVDGSCEVSTMAAACRSTSIPTKAFRASS
jgi:topoisomerase-4 subunit B